LLVWPTMHVIEADRLDDYLGRELGPSRWFLIDQPRITAFAEATEDRQWIHLEAERAQTESPYGTTIAHGFLTLSLLSAMAHDAFRVEGVHRMTINYGLNRVRFPAAVPAGARIRGRFTLIETKPFEGGVQLAWKVVVEAEGAQKPCLAAEWLTRLYE